MERIEYAGWPECIRITNGSIEIVITTVIGPRIIHCGFVGGQNLLGIIEATRGLRGGDEWRLYGGHRLWHSPELMPRSYSPDNAPVQVVESDERVRLIQDVEPETGIRKEIEVSVDAAADRVEVLHRLTNHNLWPIELAPWALTVMAQGGEAIVPQPQGDPGSLGPNRRLTLWPYTDMGDARLTWGERYIRMRQRPDMPRRCKFGLSAEDGWLAYLLNGEAFVKLFEYDEWAEYPDWGAAVELFTNNEILEVETLGPLTELDPGECVEHTEQWRLFRGVEVGTTEASIDEALAQLDFSGAQ